MAPETRAQTDVGVQQSADWVHDAPSSEQAAAQARAPWPPQSPAQHCDEKAQAPPSAMHAPDVPMTPQRLTPLLSPTQPPTPAQQLADVVQKSPAAPQAGARAWHRPTLSAPTTHDPEQQSALVAQRSQTLAQPPAGTHRFTPSGVDRHRREQQSESPEHTSPA
jgi:hypothetical protein